jgi:hypothetical protein
MMEQFSAINKREDEVKLCLRLEGKFEWNDKWVVDFGKYEALC